ncbi:hypothetical protein BLNAU_9096 [Blattamonas nauphoetae]|uniref:RRM domain-containing protein n=1 Tax=Blattamonas nauphoetae TaxID=2049346 RepID=A0ABQ9XWS8_9EUKA|nr:hypothetical protein BLNAU_9096 [Blattamonas nauphoetae]
MILRIITVDSQSQYGPQCLSVVKGDIVEVLGKDTDGWTWSKKHGTELKGYVRTQDLGPYPAPKRSNEMETPLSLELVNVNPSRTVEKEVKQFFQRFGEVYYFDIQRPSQHHKNYRFFVDVLSTREFDTIKTSLSTQPFNSSTTQLKLKLKQPNPFELYLTPLSPTCTEADIRAMIHPANPESVSLFFSKNNPNNKHCAIVFPDARSTITAFRNRSHWISTQSGLKVSFSTRSDTRPASLSPNPDQPMSTSVLLTNLPNGVVPRDIINTLFPTLVITKIDIRASPPGQPASAVVHFKTEDEAQLAIRQSGTLSILSNRIQVSEFHAQPDHPSRGSMSPKSLSPPLPHNLRLILVPPTVLRQHLIRHKQSPPPQHPPPNRHQLSPPSQPQPRINLPPPRDTHPQQSPSPKLQTPSQPQPQQRQQTASPPNRFQRSPPQPSQMPFRPQPPPRRQTASPQHNAAQRVCYLTDLPIVKGAYLRNEPGTWYDSDALENYSKISSLLEVLQCDDEVIIVDALRQLQKVASDSKSPSFIHSSLSSEIPSFIITQFGDWSNCAALDSCCSCMESLFFEPETVDTLLFQHEDLILSIFRKIETLHSSPPVSTTLARISLFPSVRIAYLSLTTLLQITKRSPNTLARLPSPIFPLSSPKSRYSDIQNCLARYTANVLVDIRLLFWCIYSCELLSLTVKNAAHSETFFQLAHDLTGFASEVLRILLHNLSSLESFQASLASTDPQSTRLQPEKTHTIPSDTIQHPANPAESFTKWASFFVGGIWGFVANIVSQFFFNHPPSYQYVFLDDPSLPHLALQSFQLTRKDRREILYSSLGRLIIYLPYLTKKFISIDLVNQLFETPDLLAIPLSESKTHLSITIFIHGMLNYASADHITHYPLVRVSVFEPVKQYVNFLFHNSNKLILDEKNRDIHELHFSWIHNHIKNMELQSDEHDTNIVSGLVKYEVQTMVEMENETHFETVFQSMLDTTSEWNLKNPERLKRREVLLREEGWDDAFELRVVGIEVDSNHHIQELAEHFRIVKTLNADDLPW